jgi:diphthamide synthase (EF-2-diphthine--ammonia ligase)
MVAIDDDSNGYRVLLLSIAETDALVMNVVLSASAYHLSSKSRNLLQVGQRLRMATIQGLLCRGDLASNDSMTNCFNIATILVLLVIEMIMGSSDFPVVFAMLKTGLDAIGGEHILGADSLGKFLIRQIRKYVDSIVNGDPLLTILCEGCVCMQNLS